MKHSINALQDIARRYYPPGIAPDDPRYQESEEHRRLVALREQAGAARGPWRAMMQRLAKQFPERCVHDDVLSCPPAALDAGYRGSISLPEAPGEHAHTVNLRVSFLVPYYVVYGKRITDDPKATEARRAKLHGRPALNIEGIYWTLPRQVIKSEILVELDRQLDELPPVRRGDLRFDLSPEEQPYGAAIVREIEATYRYEPMPPEIGNLIVPDVAASFRCIGETSLYDCLLSDHCRRT